MRLKTVNVIEITNGDIQSLRSFEDNHEGNEAAEGLFRKIIEETATDEPTDTEYQEAIEDGRWTDGNGGEVFLVHSEA